jgi:hypothetical protein
MVDIRRLFKEYCPLIEEFNVRNIMGAYEQKEWMFSYRHTLAGLTDDITLSTITGGLIQKLDHYYVLATKLNALPVNKTFVYPKTTTQFTLNGDDAGVYSIIVVGSGLPEQGASPNIVPAVQKGLTGRWAKDYCPYCKAFNIKALIGGVLADVVAFSFQWTTDNIADVIDFRTATKVTDAYNTAGQGKEYLVSQMYDTDYGIAITKNDAGAATVIYPSAITKAGFTLNGENAKAYDVLIVGQIQY